MPEKLKTIAQSIAHRLEQMILDGTLPPEKKLPSERQLAERLGVSRSVVREALSELAGRGIIETKHGQGSFAKKVIAEVTDTSPLMVLLNSHSRTLYDLYEVRALLEGEAAALAAEHGTQAEHYAITKAFNEMESVPAPTNFALDYTFHQRIVEASHNPVLVHLLASLKSPLLRSVATSLTNLVHLESFREQIERHHKQIYNAIIARNPSWARRAAAAHVKHVSDALKQLEASDQLIARDFKIEL
ncbi:MAG TPA: FCD domain-containing protein [Marinobacterium sp.]|nr:FCD domain-containing protein [Marinobacterium sp.]